MISNDRLIEIHKNMKKGWIAVSKYGEFKENLLLNDEEIEYIAAKLPNSNVEFILIKDDDYSLIIGFEIFEGSSGNTMRLIKKLSMLVVSCHKVPLFEVELDSLLEMYSRRYRQ